MKCNKDAWCDRSLGHSGACCGKDHMHFSGTGCGRSEERDTVIDNRTPVKRKRPPMQPIVVAQDGVIRFQRNEVVRALLNAAARYGFDLNALWREACDAPDTDWDQFNQLIGYSVSGCPFRDELGGYRARDKAAAMRASNDEKKGTP